MEILSGVNRRPAWRTLVRWLVVGHRWLGIATCLLFVLWFLSGVVMMFVRLPALTEAERVAAAAPIDWSAVRLPPTGILRGAPLAAAALPDDLRLEQWLGEPVYRFTAGGRAFAVSAVDGRAIAAIDRATAEAVAKAFAGNADARWLETLERDQWTVTRRYQLHRPLHRIAIADGLGTELYVSGATGEVVLDTHRGERFWNWCGAVTHWFYITALRANQGLWEGVILWTAGAGIAVALSGLWLGLQRWQRRPARLAPTPYRGWMAWHHVTGLVGGMFLLTWIVSGWLSVAPIPAPDKQGFRTLFTAREAYAAPGALDFPLSAEARTAFAAQSSRQARFAWIAGRPVALLSDRDHHTRPFDPASGAPIRWSDAELFAAMRRLLPGATLVDAIRLEQPDRYWYSHHDQRVLPVLRGVFDDASNTWLHIDPATGLMLQPMNDDSRSHRWLFKALHSLDFPWLLAYRPLWYGVVLLLSSIGLAVAISGVVIGWRRLMARR